MFIVNKGSRRGILKYVFLEVNRDARVIKDVLQEVKKGFFRRAHYEKDESTTFTSMWCFEGKWQSLEDMSQQDNLNYRQERLFIHGNKLIEQH